MGIDEEKYWDKISYVSGYLKEDSEHEDAPKIVDNPDYIIFLS